MNRPYYIVVRPGTTESLGGQPSPHLIQEGTAGTVEAYRGTGDMEWLWYLRDDKHGYTAPEYTRVRVIRNPEDVHPDWD